MASSRHAANDRDWAAGSTPPVTPATVDLHSHTARSDGLLEPIDLVRAAASCGVRLLSITDHDTLAGYRSIVAGADAIPKGLELVPGVEINAIIEAQASLAGNEIHVLGLGVDPGNDAFEATLASQRAARRVRFDRMIERLLGIGLDVRGSLTDAQRLIARPGHESEADDALGRPTVARALIAIGAATSVEDAFDRWLSRGRPAYVPRDGLGPIGAIRAIRAAGGLPVLAHYDEAAERIDVLRELIEAGLGGLEAHHLSFDEATAASVGTTADALGLLRTGGTDYHGDVETYATAHARLAIPATVEPAVRVALGRRPGPERLNRRPPPPRPPRPPAP